MRSASDRVFRFAARVLREAQDGVSAAAAASVATPSLPCPTKAGRQEKKETTRLAAGNLASVQAILYCRRTCSTSSSRGPAPAYSPSGEGGSLLTLDLVCPDPDVLRRPYRFPRRLVGFPSSYRYVVSVHILSLKHLCYLALLVCEVLPCSRLSCTAPLWRDGFALFLSPPLSTTAYSHITSPVERLRTIASLAIGVA